MAAKKKKAEETTESPAPCVKRVFKPERCTSHKFVAETNGKVDMSASYEVTDDSICFNCGLYFSTWIWYSDRINNSFWSGVDNEAGQTLNYIAQEISRQDDKIVNSWAESLLAKLRDRRTKNGK